MYQFREEQVGLEAGRLAVKLVNHLVDPLKTELDPRQLVELVVAVGFYMAACRFLETFDIDVHA